MKALFLAVALFGCGFWLTALSGCQTETPGAEYALGSYTVNVDAAPDKVTDASRKAVEDMKFENILSNGTKIDGNVSARTANGDAVTIDISQAGENVSKVTVHVGSAGDQSVSKQIVDRIKAHLSWF